MFNLIGEGMPLVCAVIALIMGRKAWAVKTKALFPKLIAAGLGCTALGYLHNLVYYLVMGTAAAGLYISFLGIIGCYIFLLCASYGQLDGILDDGSREFRKARMLALLAPLGMHLLFIPILVSDQLSIGLKIVNYVGWLPIIFASYFNLKHALLPDCGFAFVNAVRPYNVVAVVMEALQVVYLTTRICHLSWGVAVSSALLGAAMIALMYFAKKGAEKWTI